MRPFELDDGKIFVRPVEEAGRTRTGERGASAIACGSATAQGRIGARRLSTSPHAEHDFTISWAPVCLRALRSRTVGSSTRLAFLLLNPCNVSPRWRVLVVGDHASSKAAVAEAVTAMGGVVVGQGSSVAEAPARVERIRPDVVILAVGLPDGDSLEVARAVMDRFPCPIVLLTSRTAPNAVERANAACAMAVLIKPFQPEELGPALDSAVAHVGALNAIRNENEELKRAVESRKLVERAKGLLMEQDGLTEAEAFRRIRKASMDNRKPIAEVAEAILLAEAVGKGLERKPSEAHAAD